MNPAGPRIAIRRFIGLAVLALLLGQWTVLRHALAHTGSSPALAAFAAVDAATDTVAVADESWGHAAGSSVCQLVDQWLVGQLLGADAAASPCVPPAPTRAASPGSPIWSSPGGQAYQARGPPRT